MRSRLTYLLLLVSVVFGWGSGGEARAQSGASSRSARLVIVLELEADALEGVELGIEAMSVLVSQQRVLLEPETWDWRSTELRGRSLRLLDAPLIPGRLDSLFLDIGEIVAPLLGAPVRPPVPEGGVRLWLGGTKLRAGDAILLRLRWNPRTVEPAAESYSVDVELLPPADVPPGAVAYVSNERSDHISVIDLESNRVVDVLPAAGGPRDLAYSPLDQRLYCALSGSDELLLIDTISRAILHKLPLNYGDRPSRLAFSPDFQTIYVLNLQSHSVVGVSVNSLQEVVRMPAGTQPRDIAVDPSSGFLYISTDLPGELLVLDPLTRREASRLAVDPSPSELAIDPSAGLLLVASAERRRVLVFELSTGNQLDRIPLCAPARGLAIVRGQNRVLVAIGDCRRVEMVVPVPAMEAGWFPVEGRPGRIALGAQSRRVFVTLPELNSIQIYNLGSQQALATVQVGKMPHTVLKP